MLATRHTRKNGLNWRCARRERRIGGECDKLFCYRNFEIPAARSDLTQGFSAFRR